MTDAAGHKRKYRNPLADFPDQLLFFGLFAIGAAGIWVLKANGYHQVVVTAFPVCLMGIYAIIALVTKRYRLREDRVGDNIYYLGFLFTLVSLAYALYVYNPNGSGATEIITNFGIAIFTTIFGLAGRIFFNQMREDPVEFEREARYSLAEASNSLRSSLGDISTEMSNFKRKIVQITEEGVTDVTNIASDAMAKNVDRLSATAEEVINKIEEAFSAFTNHSSRLNEIASQNVGALQALFERIEKIEASPELLAKKFEPVVSQFQEVADEALRRSRAQTSDIKRLRELIDTGIKSFDGLREAADGSDKIVTQRLSHLTTSIDKSLAASELFGHTVNEASAALRSELAARAHASAELKEGLTGQKQYFAEIRSTIESDLRAIRQHREEMEILAKESRASVQSLQGALVSLSKTLVEQLRAP